MQKIKQKTQNDFLKSSLLKNSNELLINDDEDKFMEKLGGDATTSGDKIYEIDREAIKDKKREAKKDLRFYQLW